MRVTILGLGLMGLPIAHRLMQKGHEVTAWNRGEMRLEQAKSEGVPIEADLLKAVNNNELLLLTLSDAEAIDAVLFSPSLEGHLQGKTVIQMGTISPDESRALAQRVQAVGGEYLEAPVLGSIPEALAGELIVMAAGPEPVYHHCLLLLRGLGKEVDRVGNVGQAAAMKLAMNQLIAALTVGFSQSLGLVKAEGVDVEQFMKLLRESALYAPTFDKKLQKYQEHDYGKANFPLKHLIKDVRLFKQVAESSGMNAEVANATLSVLLKGEEAGYGEDDYSALYEAINPGFDAETDIGC
ncbi:MAG: NAD(P)-dependent oxidoreductase [Candidatus Thiodiazotropha sp.]